LQVARHVNEDKTDQYKARKSHQVFFPQ